MTISMALTFSRMFPLGGQAPSFELPDTVSGKMISLKDIQSDMATVVMFICNHCPYVKHVNHEITAIAKEYGAKGISFVGISSNDVDNYPDDAPVLMKEVAAKEGYPFPYLYDETQEVAKAYMAACTPDFYVFDKDLKCVYRGQMDEARPKNDVPVTGKDLRTALDAVLNGRPVPEDQKPSAGCGIKWKNPPTLFQIGS